MECEAYACGKGTEGQLGREELYIGCPVPSPVSTLRRIVKITAGTSHCLALTDKGEIYAWGSGTGYKLGCANQQDEPIPIKLEFEQFMIDIAVGQNHSVAVDERGLVHTWGSGREGQLGYVVVKEDKTPKCLSSTCFDGHIMTKCFANSCYTYALRYLNSMHTNNQVKVE
jgi:alpha-tubulin suppressor-like RCC1 family protein